MCRRVIMWGMSCLIAGLLGAVWMVTDVGAASRPAAQQGDPQAPALGKWSTSKERSLQVSSPSRVDESGIVPVRIVAPGQARVSLRWQGKTYPLKMLDGQAVTLLPAPDKRPASGSCTLEVQADGAKVRRTVAVRAVRWPVQKLSVEPRYVNPPQAVSQRIASERKRTAEALSRARAERLWQGTFVRPLKHMTTTNVFGGKRFFNGQLRSRHRGLDLRGATGTPVRSVAAGRVLLAEEQYFSGNMVYVDHGDGLLTLYCHLSRIDVRPGERVRAGQTLGLVGATGRVTGPHLHLGVRLRGQMVNPLALFALPEALSSRIDKQPRRVSH